VSEETFRQAEAILNQVIEISRSTALGEMASGFAHEINQPLGAIATFSQAAIRMLDRSDPAVPRALEVLRQISHEAINAGEGIRRIRRLFDQDDLSTSRCCVDDLITELRPALELLSRRCRGTLYFAPAPSPALSLDRAKIQHVIFSLVQNGFESAKETSAAPCVRLHVVHDRYQVETHVTDSGPGVPAGARARLFKPFFTTKARGTGLGLASSHSIIAAHGGKIGYDNLEGQGCRFWFRLPLTLE
jgi:C4-dicarboxylate-specific signal transduction histidine kinase